MTIHLKNILLVEDNSSDALLLQEMLTRDAHMPMDLCWTECLRDTLDRLRHQTFDAILLDLSLPDSNGFDTIRQVFAAARAIPILVVTGVTDEQMAMEAVRYGAEDYLVKGRINAWSVARAISYAIERKRREERIAKLSRLYAVLSQVNEVIVRAADVESLYANVCRIVAQTGNFPLAWIGQVQGPQVVPVAWCGSEGDYLQEIEVEVQGELGGGPTGRCIREGRAVVNDDFTAARETAPWREAAKRHGFRSSAAFPLCRRGTVIGALTLYACQPDAFDAEQVGLLESLSADISYAIDAREHERERIEAERALKESQERLLKAHDELEQRVAERTAELAETVEDLHVEVQERVRAEQLLQHEHRTLVHLLQATDRERQAISLGIHDSLAQPMVSATMHLEAAGGMNSRTSKAAAKAQAAGLAMLRQSINEARRLISGVRPPILEDEGVEAAIAHLVYERRDADAPQIELHIDAQFGRLAPTLESAIYRIVQEGIENARRHSRSDRVRTELVQQDNRLRIEIRDWGVGFDPQAIKEESFGLEEIRERARLLGGTASIESAPGKGTRIVADLPLVPLGTSS